MVVLLVILLAVVVAVLAFAWGYAVRAEVLREQWLALAGERDVLAVERAALQAQLRLMGLASNAFGAMNRVEARQQPTWIDAE